MYFFLKKKLNQNSLNSDSPIKLELLARENKGEKSISLISWDSTIEPLISM